MSNVNINKLDFTFGHRYFILIDEILLWMGQIFRFRRNLMLWCTSGSKHAIYMNIFEFISLLFIAHNMQPLTWFRPNKWWGRLSVMMYMLKLQGIYLYLDNELSYQNRHVIMSTLYYCPWQCHSIYCCGRS